MYRARRSFASAYCDHLHSRSIYNPTQQRCTRKISDWDQTSSVVVIINPRSRPRVVYVVYTLLYKAV